MKVKGLIIAVTTMTLAVGCFSGCSSATDDTAEYHCKMALNSSAGDAAYDGAVFFKEKIEEITNGIKIETGSRILDLGCGKGITSIFLAEKYDSSVFAADLWKSVRRKVD